MIDANKLLDIHGREEMKKFDNMKKIIPIIDNRFKYNDTVYELTDFDIHLLTDFRIAFGYDRYYDGYEKRPGDANSINGMLLSAVWSITETIDYEIADRVEGEKHKIICKEIK